MVGCEFGETLIQSLRIGKILLWFRVLDRCKILEVPTYNGDTLCPTVEDIHYELSTNTGDQSEE